MRSPARANPGKRYFVLLFRTGVDTSQGSGFSSIQLVSVAGRKPEREKEKTSILCYSPRHHRFDSFPQKKNSQDEDLAISRQVNRNSTLPAFSRSSEQTTRHINSSSVETRVRPDASRNSSATISLPNLLPLSLRDFHCLSSDLSLERHGQIDLRFSIALSSLSSLHPRRIVAEAGMQRSSLWNENEGAFLSVARRRSTRWRDPPIGYIRPGTLIIESEGGQVLVVVERRRLVGGGRRAQLRTRRPFLFFSLPTTSPSLPTFPSFQPSYLSSTRYPPLDSVKCRTTFL